MQSVVVFVCLLSITYLHAQVGGAVAEPQKDAATATLPSADLVFSEPKQDSPLQLPSPVMSEPPRCGLDGRAFLQIMGPPPRYSHKVIYSITPDGKVTHYPVEQIVGLTYFGIIAFDAGSSMPVMLLEAAAAGASSETLTHIGLTTVLSHPR